MNNQRKIKKIIFEKIGRKKQHDVTLFGIGEKAIEIDETLIFTLSAVRH